MKHWYIVHSNKEETDPERFWSGKYGWTTLEYSDRYDDGIVAEAMPANGSWQALDWCSREQVKNASLDYCPVCGNPATLWCRCPESHRSCAYGHNWIRYTGGLGKVLPADVHGKANDTRSLWRVPVNTGAGDVMHIRAKDVIVIDMNQIVADGVVIILPVYISGQPELV